MKYREPYLRAHHNRFGDCYIVIPCACGAGHAANRVPGTPTPPFDPPHREDCPILLKRQAAKEES